MSKDYNIYTDGAFSSKRNQGGIGIVVLKDDDLIQSFNKAYKNTTNNRMELIAVIIALNSIKKPIDTLNIYSDSMYVIGCATLGWKRKKNIDLWEKYEKTFQNTKKLVNKINFIHIKGHEGNKWNEFCDTLAVQASQND